MIYTRFATCRQLWDVFANDIYEGLLCSPPQTYILCLYMGFGCWWLWVVFVNNFYGYCYVCKNKHPFSALQVCRFGKTVICLFAATINIIQTIELINTGNIDFVKELGLPRSFALSIFPVLTASWAYIICILLSEFA